MMVRLDFSDFATILYHHHRRHHHRRLTITANQQLCTLCYCAFTLHVHAHCAETRLKKYRQGCKWKNYALKPYLEYARNPAVWKTSTPSQNLVDSGAESCTNRHSMCSLSHDNLTTYRGIIVTWHNPVA
jgi:hypothetical protein